MRKIISLICFLLPFLTFVAEPGAFAAEPENRSDIRLDIRSDAPDRHIVIKGDTLTRGNGHKYGVLIKTPLRIRTGFILAT